MKNIIIFILAMLLIGSQACTKYETPVPELENFGVYEIVDEQAGSELSTVPAGETVRMQVFTDCDICVIWTGEYSYVPYGTSDSLLDSHAYEHYGQLGAQGHSTGQIEGDTKGWFLDYSWDAGTYTVTIILTNHGIDGPEYEQRVFDEQITVQ